MLRHRCSLRGAACKNLPAALRPRRRRTAAAKGREVHEGAHVALPQRRGDGGHGDDEGGEQHADFSFLQCLRTKAFCVGALDWACA